jgi:hypothetical protein
MDYKNLEDGWDKISRQQLATYLEFSFLSPREIDVHL